MVRSQQGSSGAVVARRAQATPQTLFIELRELAREYHVRNATTQERELVATANFVRITFDDIESYMNGKDVLRAVRYAYTRRKRIVIALHVGCALAVIVAGVWAGVVSNEKLATVRATSILVGIVATAGLSVAVDRILLPLLADPNREGMSKWAALRDELEKRFGAEKDRRGWLSRLVWSRSKAKSREGEPNHDEG